MDWREASKGTLSTYLRVTNIMIPRKFLSNFVRCHDGIKLKWKYVRVTNIIIPRKYLENLVWKKNVSDVNFARWHKTKAENTYSVKVSSFLWSDLQIVSWKYTSELMPNFPIESFQDIWIHFEVNNFSYRVKLMES